MSTSMIGSPSRVHRRRTTFFNLVPALVHPVAAVEDDAIVVWGLAILHLLGRLDVPEDILDVLGTVLVLAVLRDAQQFEVAPDEIRCRLRLRVQLGEVLHVVRVGETTGAGAELVPDPKHRHLPETTYDHFWWAIGWSQSLSLRTPRRSTQFGGKWR